MGSTSYISDKNGNITQHVEYIAFGEILFEEHNTSFSSPYLFNGKELDRETNLSYYGARYLDMKTSLWLNVDPLAEKMPNYGAYVYTFNNPVKYTDPTGMIADPPVGIDAEDGSIYSDNTGSWKYEKSTTTWKGQNGAKDIGNTIELNNVNVKGYKSDYVPSGEYGPYRPDGYGFSVSGSVDYNLVSYNMSLDLVLDASTNEFGLFSTITPALSTTLGYDWNFGASISIIDKYDQPGSKNKQDLFKRVLDYSKGGTVTFGNWGVSHFQSATLNEEGEFKKQPSGVIINSLNFSIRPERGASFGISNTKRIF